MEKLETAAWATWYTHMRVLTEAAGASGSRVAPVLYEASGALLRDLLKLIEYHVGSVPDVAVEIADIRVGTGYQDRASDLVRTAALWDKWQSELAADNRLYHAGDGDRARDSAQPIITALRAHTSDSAAEWIDLRSRAFTLVNELYSEIYAAGQFFLRHRPEDFALFVPLRQVVVPVRRRTTSPNPEPNPESIPEPPPPAVPAEST